jgi:hypothetical protein
MTTTDDIQTLSSEQLATVSGGDIGINRETYTGGGEALGSFVGGQAAKYAATAATAETGPGALVAGQVAKVAGKKAGGWIGNKVGGAIYDAGTALGTWVGNMLYPSHASTPAPGRAGH